MAKAALPAPALMPWWALNQPGTAAPSLTAVGSGQGVGAVGSTDRFIVTGSVYWVGGGTKTCASVRWRSGASSLVGTLRVGLRDPDAANGPPGRDDAGVDGNDGTHVNPAANTVFTTTLGAGRSIASGALISLVFDLTAYTSGSVRLPSCLAASAYQHGLAATYYNGTTYAAADTAMIICITFVADDGTRGIFVGGLPCVSSVTTRTFANDDTPDERANAFTISAPLWAGQNQVLHTTVAGGGFALPLYRGTTELAAPVVDANNWTADATTRWNARGFADVELQSGQTHYQAMKPDSTTDVTIYEPQIAAGDALAIGILGVVTRTDAGSWSAVTDTAFLYGLGIAITATDDAAAAGGGMLVHPGMAGGLRG